MTTTPQPTRRRGPVALGELVGKVIDPVTAQRGFAAADLVASWPEIVGQRFATCTRPEKIVWPRGESRQSEPAILVVRVEGPRAIYLQHEAGQILERVNAFLGYGALGSLRIVQGPVIHPAGSRPTPARALDAAGEARLAKTIAGVADDKLKAALDRLGRGVMTDPAEASGPEGRPP